MRYLYVVESDLSFIDHVRFGPHQQYWQICNGSNCQSLVVLAMLIVMVMVMAMVMLIVTFFVRNIVEFFQVILHRNFVELVSGVVKQHGCVQSLQLVFVHFTNEVHPIPSEFLMVMFAQGDGDSSDVWRPSCGSSDGGDGDGGAGVMVMVVMVVKKVPF